VEDLANLLGVEATGPRVWVVTTLERVMAKRHLDLMGHLHQHYRLVHILPGTLGDGAMRIYILEEATQKERSSMPLFMGSERQSYWKRRIWRHFVLSMVSGALMAGIFHVVQVKDSMFRLSIASAYAALAILSVSLIIGPWNVLCGRSNPVSTEVGLQVHMRGKFWLYFLYPPSESHLLPIRSDFFGFANYTGLIAAIVFISLLALSNNLSLRWLGKRHWKALQRWNYVGFVLVAAHGVAYQLLEKRWLSLVILFSSLLLVTVAMQFAGWRRIHRQTH
jgi:sulfoxide reductase heme-binding subunit YedZ